MGKINARKQYESDISYHSITSTLTSITPDERLAIASKADCEKSKVYPLNKRSSAIDFNHHRVRVQNFEPKYIPTKMLK